LITIEGSLKPRFHDKKTYLEFIIVNPFAYYVYSIKTCEELVTRVSFSYTIAREDVKLSRQDWNFCTFLRCWLVTSLEQNILAEKT